MEDTSSMNKRTKVPDVKRRRTSRNRAQTPSAVPQVQSLPPTFPIVGIGASAGGLEAFEAFFTAMPAQAGIAFVLVQHLQPTTKSLLAELIRRFTPMPVHQVTDGLAIEPNHIYVIPPDYEMALLHGRLHLFTPQALRGHRLPIDSFFRSLASDLHEHAIGIILSGTGSDGALGARAIAGEGGMVMVQEPQSAQYDGMPRSAIATDVSDYVLAPAQMPAKLLAYVQQLFSHLLPTSMTTDVPLREAVTSDALQKIFILLRAHTGHDFSYYKPKTIQRRIERRMVVNQIGQLADYVRFLQEHPQEIEILFRDLMIGVTHFFRDPDAFAVLGETVIPKLLANLAFDQPLRIWVPGCSTGEEAYSLAMLFREQQGQSNHSPKVLIFATDIDDLAINKARAGIYAEGISADLSPERLQRFFTQENGGFVVKKTIRDMIVFATQNVVEDPPFSKVDLISCRNLLIYLDSAAQQKLIPLFHYALNPDGFLLLGNSETVGEFGDLFMTLDRKWKLFQRQGLARKARPALNFTTPAIRPTLTAAAPSRSVDNLPKPTFRQVAEQELLTHHTPASILINEQAEILYVHGRTGHYLEPSPGDATLNLLKMARPGLRMELTAAVRKVFQHKVPVTIEGLSVKVDETIHRVNLTVKPITTPATMPGLVLVVLAAVPASTQARGASAVPPALPNKDEQIARLERELQTKEAYLQTTVEELETANEELQSTNEELQSANEELQSTNEELETAKEELQSVNEELLTVNTELQQKIEEVSRVNGDLSNLLAGTQIGMIFLDFELRVQRFTPAVTQVIHLIQSDVGRPVHHIVTNLKYSTLIQDIQQVLETLIPQEHTVETTAGRWYLLRISPYRNVNNVIEGAVITFVNVTEQKKVEDALRQLTQVVAQSPNLVIITDRTGIIQYINTQVTATTGYTVADAVGRPLTDWLVAADQAHYPQIVAQALAGQPWRGEWQSKKKQGTPYWAAVSISPLKAADLMITGLVIVQEDITERKMIERLAVVVRDAYDAITVLNFDGEILAWNPGAERLYGWRESDALTMKIFDMIDLAPQAAIVNLLARLRQGDIVSPLEIAHRCRNGTTVNILLTATILVDQNGAPYAIATTEKQLPSGLGIIAQNRLENDKR